MTSVANASAGKALSALIRRGSPYETCSRTNRAKFRPAVACRRLECTYRRSFRSCRTEDFLHPLKPIEPLLRNSRARSQRAARFGALPSSFLIINGATQLWAYELYTALDRKLLPAWIARSCPGGPRMCWRRSRFPSRTTVHHPLRGRRGPRDTALRMRRLPTIDA